jgi:hypothetical protein
MKYQRARIIKNGPILKVGMLVWVRAERPRDLPLQDIYTGHFTGFGLRYQTNIKGLHPNSLGVAFKPERAELLARGPEDFAEDIPMIAFEEFLESQKTPGSL